MDLGFVLQNLRLEHRTSQRHRYIVIIHGIGYRVVPTYLFGFKSGIPYWIFLREEIGVTLVFSVSSTFHQSELFGVLVSERRHRHRELHN